MNNSNDVNYYQIVDDKNSHDNLSDAVLTVSNYFLENDNTVIIDDNVYVIIDPNHGFS